MERVLLKACEVGQALGVGRSLVYQLISEGQIPSVRVGRCIRVPKSWLDRWVSDQQMKQASPVNDVEAQPFLGENNGVNGERSHGVASKQGCCGQRHFELSGHPEGQP